jgi:hypothetical protein
VKESLYTCSERGNLGLSELNIDDLQQRIKSFNAKAKVFGWAKLRIKVKDDKVILLGPVNRDVEKVVIPNFVTHIAKKAFENCLYLQEISIPDSVIYVGSFAFQKCKNLREIHLPDGINQIDDLTFSECTSLAYIKFPRNLLRIGRWAFYKCESLIEIHMPEKLRILGDSAFSSCINLKKVVLPDKLQKIETSVFDLCKSLVDINIPKYLREIPAGFLDWTSISGKLEIPNGVILIDDFAFSNTKIESVVIPKSIKKIGNSAFKNCKNLKEVFIPREFGNWFNDVFSPEITNSQDLRIVHY